LYPGLSETIKIVEKQMQGENRMRAGDKEEIDADDAEESTLLFTTDPHRVLRDSLRTPQGLSEDSLRTLRTL
jgi:hypothetical protein